MFDIGSSELGLTELRLDSEVDGLKSNWLLNYEVCQPLIPPQLVIVLVAYLVIRVFQR